ncbi:efflux RND transporter periplasmic adaptor subunit [uncultured Thiohalocapsa sp.]|uniref:efflux RND transporter periplasmic adaptor subunit n=1 Tax=uncultured Thiohalocapsa sp. TaxID=768990 RepID=UPI0025FCF469|nr:efflux RND transporter periplasmic adaptor subunit [uncultured Thiohalocapsa sp.]
MAQHTPYRYSLFNPDALFGVLARALRPLWWTVFLLIPGVPVALLTVAHHQRAYAGELAAIFQGNTALTLLLGFVLILGVVNVLTKVVQGMVAIHCGAPIGQFGFSIAFGLRPHFFIDKRATWKLPRGSRLWVYGSNLAVRLGLFVLGIMLWIWTDHAGTALSAIAFSVAHIALGSFFFIANPLWPADGYRFLASYLDRPLLRPRAFQYVRLRLSGHRAPVPLSPARASGLVAYAVASTLYVVYVLASVLLLAATALEERFNGAGVVIFLVLLSLFVRYFVVTARRRRERQAAKRQQRLGRRRDGPAPPGAAGPVAAGPWSRRNKRRLWVAAALVAMVVAPLPYPYHVSGIASVESRHTAGVYAQVSGDIAHIAVADAQQVHKGQLIAMLDTEDAAHALAIAEAELDAGRAELAVLRRGPLPERVERARLALAQAALKAGFTTERWHMLAATTSAGLISPLQRAELAEAAALDTAAVAVAGAALGAVGAPPTPEAVQMQAARVRALEERVAALRAELAEHRLLAPIAGRLIAPDLYARRGDRLQAGAPLAQVVDTGDLRIRILVPETQVNAVAPDAAVAVKLWPLPGQVFAGRVETIAPSAETAPESPFVRIVRVTAGIDAAPPRLRPGMGGYAKISAGRQPVLFVFGQFVARMLQVAVWSWIP